MALLDDLNNADNVKTDQRRKSTHTYFRLIYPILDPDGGAKAVAGYPSFGADISVTVTSTSTTSGLNSLAAGLYVITCTQATHADQPSVAIVPE